MKKIIGLFLFMSLFLSCDELSNNKMEDAKPIPLKKGMQKRVEQDNAFAFDLFKEVVATTDEKNVFISPLSVSMALGMTWNGAEGATKSGMEAALKLSDMTPDEINEYYQIVLDNLPSVDKSTQLNIANSIWYREGFSIKQPFVEINKEYFKAEIKDLDFSHPSALKTINNWCAKQTNNLIKEPLDRITADAMMYLINAIYFKGIWVNKFDKKHTSDDDFHTEDQKVNRVKMMYQQNGFRYHEDEKAQYLDMPYGNKAFSMTVVLPKEDVSTQEALDAIDAKKWNNIINSHIQEVKVYFPKFKIEAKYILNQVLSNMGMEQAFSRSADFSGITDESLHISRIIHSTFCDVNEEGTEAAAVTIVEMELTSSPPDNVPIFEANRPFIFMIRENSTGLILFMGKMGAVEMYK